MNVFFFFLMQRVVKFHAWKFHFLIHTHCKSFKISLNCLTLCNVLRTSNLSLGSHCILRKLNRSALLNLPKSVVFFANVLFGAA